jgi:hypothetical protein
LFPYRVQGEDASIIDSTELSAKYPLAWDYLNANREKLRERERGKFRDSEWYRFGRSQNIGMWEQPKILVPYMMKRLSAHFDRYGGMCFVNVTTGGYGLTAKDASITSYEYLTGLLNSKVLAFFFQNVASTFQGGYFGASKQYLEQLPIRTIDFDDPADVARHDKMVSLVQQMLDLHEQRDAVRTDQDKKHIQRLIDATDRDIDHLVYELYDLTDEEIAIVEGELG